ncbi:MAG: ribonuclease III [Actinomycetota bacterium]|nr:ribonuclease III [Actinomycetota bacterium]
MSKPNKPTDLLEALGVSSQPGGLYEVALTHRSFAFEQPDPAIHNERLELLGDAVLGLVVTDLIFHAYPDLSEGELAPLRASVVNTTALAEVARSIGLGRLIRLGRGEEVSGGRDKDSLLANTLEALIGAAYIEQGTEAVMTALAPAFAEKIEATVARGARFDAKGALQERVVRTGRERPSYQTLSSGPDHDKQFVAQVFIAGRLEGAGTGRSKKEAEQNAAREALARLDGTPEATEEAIDA